MADRHLVRVGAEVYDEYIGASRTFEDVTTGTLQPTRPKVPDGTRYTSLGLFLHESTDIVPGRVSVRGGVRYGRFAFSTRPDPALGVGDEGVVTDAVTFHAGMVFGLTQTLNATVKVSRGFRAANAYDLGAIGLTGGGGFEMAPSTAVDLEALLGSSDGTAAVSTGRPLSALGPETAYSFEAGLKLDTGVVSGALTVFDLELVDAIQRRAVMVGSPVVGTVVAGHEIVRQDEAGRIFVAADPRPIVTRANVDRARIVGFEAVGEVRLGQRWLAGAHLSMADGHELGTGAFLRRMPPPIGGAFLRWASRDDGLWVEGVARFARPQTRLSPGDLSDARIGGFRTRSAIAGYFTGNATAFGLVEDGRLVETDETLAEVQDRVLGEADGAVMYDRTAGFLVLGVRVVWQVSARVALTLIGENLTDRNYRLHGSGVDASGANLQLSTRFTF